MPKSLHICVYIVYTVYILYSLSLIFLPIQQEIEHILCGGIGDTSMNKENIPDWCGSMGWALSHKVKGQWFSSQSAHMLGLRVQSPAGACAKGNQSMLLSYINASLPLFLPPPPQRYINKILEKIVPGFTGFTVQELEK